MATRINRAIELLAQDQAIYYVGQHTGHVLSYAQGREDAHTWADYINVGMEHGSFDMPGLAEYLRGLVDGGPTRSGHRMPAVIVEPPARGIDEASVRHNAGGIASTAAREPASPASARRAAGRSGSRQRRAAASSCRDAPRRREGAGF
jgi:hypothetical protein